MESTLWTYITRDVVDCILLWPYMIIYLHLGYIVMKLKLPEIVQKIIQVPLLVMLIYIFGYLYLFKFHPNWLFTSR